METIALFNRVEMDLMALSASVYFNALTINILNINQYERKFGDL